MLRSCVPFEVMLGLGALFAPLALAMPGEIPQQGCSMPSMPGELNDSLSGLGVKAIEVPSDQIEKYMPLGADIPGLPASIQGIWWMDGNPGGLLVSLGSAHWDPITHTATLRMMGQGSYSFKPDSWDKCQLEQLGKADVRFVIEFNQSETFATLVNETTDDKGNPEVNNDAVYTMTLLEDGHWVRHSEFLNGLFPYDYQLRRIVNAKGQRDPAYADYVAFAPKTSVVLQKITP